MRPRRSWLFVPGADAAAHAAAARSGADVLIQELEDFTPPDLRPQARGLAGSLFDRWRKAGKIAAVRINPLESCRREDLAPGHAAAINKIFSVSELEKRNAERLVEAFEKARKKGKGRAKVDGKLVEVPIYAAAKRLLERCGR